MDNVARCTECAQHMYGGEGVQWEYRGELYRFCTQECLDEYRIALL